MIFVKRHFKKAFFNAALSYELMRLVNDAVHEANPTIKRKKDDRQLRRLEKTKEDLEEILISPLDVPQENRVLIYAKAEAKAAKIFKKWADEHHYANPRG